MSTGHMVREGEIKNSYFHRSKGRATIFLNFVPRRLRTFNFPSRLPFSWRISLMHFYELFVEKIPTRWLFVCGIFLRLVREEGECSSKYRRKLEFKDTLQHWRKSKSEPNLFRLSNNIVKVQTDLSTSKVIVRIWTNLLLLIKERHRNPNKCCNIEESRRELNLNWLFFAYGSTLSESKQIFQHRRNSSVSTQIDIQPQTLIAVPHTFVHLL